MFQDAREKCLNNKLSSEDSLPFLPLKNHQLLIFLPSLNLWQPGIFLRLPTNGSTYLSITWKQNRVQMKNLSLCKSSWDEEKHNACNSRTIRKKHGSWLGPKSEATCIMSKKQSLIRLYWISSKDLNSPWRATSKLTHKSQEVPWKSI